MQKAITTCYCKECIGKFQNVKLDNSPKSFFCIVFLFPITVLLYASLAKCSTNSSYSIGENVVTILESLSKDLFESRTATGRRMFKVLDELLPPKIRYKAFILALTTYKLQTRKLHFRLPSVAQKRLCLSSLLSFYTNQTCYRNNQYLLWLNISGLQIRVQALE